MKKISLPIGVLIISSFLFSACTIPGFSQNSESTGNQESMELEQGVKTQDTNSDDTMMDSDKGSDADKMMDTTSDQAMEKNYQFRTVLDDVTGGNSSGVASAKYEDSQYDLFVTFENLPEPEGTDFYEGWIVRKSPQDVISTGALTKNAAGEYENIYTTATDLTDHTFYVLTLEPDDGDPAPALHILEGTLEKL